MSIQSPLTDAFYIRPVRPERRIIRVFVKYYPYIVGGLISLAVATSLIPVNLKLALLILLGYWGYIALRLGYRGSRKWGPTYSHPYFQLIRVVGLIAGVTALLYYVYNKTSYLQIVQDDALWLLYYPAITVTSQRGSRIALFTALIIVIICLFFVHPVIGMNIIIPAQRAITLEFLVKSEWLVFLSFTSYILIRYMSDALADLNLITNIQNKMREMEGGILRSKAFLSEGNYLEKAIEIIKADLSYDHVNIFRLDKYNKELICVAGACEQGKKLAKENYRVNVMDQESIIGHVIKTEESYITNDVTRDPHYLALQVFPATRAELAVPIRVRNRLYGVLDIQVDQPEYFLDQDRKAIEILANYVGWVIDNSEQFQHLSWVNRIVESIAAPIFTQNHLDETLQEIADSALEELQADLVFLYSYDRSLKEELAGPIYSGDLFHPEHIAPTTLNPENVVFRLVSASERTYIHEDLEHANLNDHPLLKPSPAHVTAGRPTFIEREKIKSHVIIRLLNNGQCVGVLFLNFRKPRTFTDWEKKRYFSFAHLAALAIQKMQLQQHAIQKEKAELSNLIHDMLIGDTVGLFKVLKSINLPHENGTTDKARKGVELAIEATEHLHNDIRWINRLLKENNSDDLMLELDKLFMLFKQVFNVEAEAKWNGDSRAISPVLASDLFIIIREALTNAVRHGKAQKINITIVIKLEELSATINDDGVGFNPKLVKRMSGLLSMKYRIEELAGTFKLISNPGKGTKIALRVPLQSSKAGV